MTVHFIGGRKKQKWRAPAFPRRFNNVERASHIDVKIGSWIVNRSSYRHLSGKVIDLGRGLNRFLDKRGIPDIANGNSHATGFRRNLLQPFQVVLDASSRDIVKDVNIRVRGPEQVVSPIGTNKPSSSEDQSGPKLHQLLHVS